MEDTLDLKILWRIFIRHIVLILIITVVTGAIGVVLAQYVVPKSYTSEAKLYVENKSATAESLNVNDINAAQKLVNTCQILFKTDTILLSLKDKLNLSYDVGQLDSMITVASINSTEVLSISAKTSSPELSLAIAQEFSKLCVEVYQQTIESGSIKNIDPATLNEQPVFPSKKMFGIAGASIGFIITYVIIFLKEFFDTKVKPDDDLFELYGVPVFAEILDFEAKTKGEYKYAK